MGPKVHTCSHWQACKPMVIMQGGRKGSTHFCHERTRLGTPGCSLVRVACAQARASRLSFADIVRRLAALPKEDSAYVSSKARTSPACQPMPPMRLARLMPGRICSHNACWLVPVPVCV